MTEESDLHTLLEEELKKLRIENDDYLGTIQALYAFADSARWDEDVRNFRPGSQRSIPRTMTVRVGEETRNLTPDCVVQVTEEYGVIAEAKKHYRDAEDTCAFTQIANYDQPLIGWWTLDEKIDSHDLVLLTHYLSSTRACDAYQNWKAAGSSFERPFAIVEFNFADQATVSFVLKRVEGRLSDKRHDESLRLGKPIPVRLVIEHKRRYKFYDADPPDAHTMLLLHDYIFPMLRGEEDFDALREHEHPVLRISVEEARDRLAEQFCDPPHKDRQPHLPKINWVRRALNRFVDLGLAARDPGEPDAFLVALKKPRKKDTLEYFAERIVRQQLKTRELAVPRRKKKSEGQLSLFKDSL